MSGGYFNHNQYIISDIASQIEEALLQADLYNLSERDKLIFKDAIRALHIAYTYAHRIDWYLSGDDGQEHFYTYLERDLQELGQQVKAMPSMNIYLVTRDDGADYAQYVEMVVYATTAFNAKRMHPSGDSSLNWHKMEETWGERGNFGWPHISKLTVRYLGAAYEGAKEGVISASFRHG